MLEGSICIDTDIISMSKTEIKEIISNIVNNAK